MVFASACEIIEILTLRHVLGQEVGVLWSGTPSQASLITARDRLLAQQHYGLDISNFRFIEYHGKLFGSR